MRVAGAFLLRSSAMLRGPYLRGLNRGFRRGRGGENCSWTGRGHSTLLHPSQVMLNPRASAISAVHGSAGKQPRLHPAGSPPAAPRAQRKTGAAATANHDRQGQRGKERPGVQRCPFRVFRVFRGSSCASLRLPLLVAALPLGASVVHCLVRERRRLVSSDAPTLWLAKVCFRKLNGPHLLGVRCPNRCSSQ